MQLSKSAALQLIRRQALRPSIPSLSLRRTLLCGISRQLHSSIFPRPPLVHSHYFTALQLLQRRFNSLDAPHSSQSFSEPSRPDLFYHIVQAPTPISKTLPAYALSFSSEKPPSSLSTTIIGWLPAQEKAREGTPGSQSNAGDATLADFVVNPAFVDVLHSAIKDGLTEGVDEIQKAGAMQTVEGWMHIHDERNLPALNRIGEPDDIIGTVLVENSEIRPETYQPMPAYRLVTADGLMQLTPGLAQKLKDTLAKIAEAEKSSLS